MHIVLSKMLRRARPAYQITGKAGSHPLRVRRPPLFGSSFFAFLLIMPDELAVSISRQALRRALSMVLAWMLRESGNHWVALLCDDRYLGWIIRRDRAMRHTWMLATQNLELVCRGL